MVTNVCVCSIAQIIRSKLFDIGNMRTTAENFVEIKS